MKKCFIICLSFTIFFCFLGFSDINSTKVLTNIKNFKKVKENNINLNKTDKVNFFKFTYSFLKNKDRDNKKVSNPNSINITRNSVSLKDDYLPELAISVENTNTSNTPATSNNPSDVDQNISSSSVYTYDATDVNFKFRELPRDPFKSLVKKGRVISEDKKLVKLEELTLIGIIRSGGIKKALFKDLDGIGHVIVEGGRIESGFLKRIDPDKVVFVQEDFDGVHEIEVKLRNKEE